MFQKAIIACLGVSLAGCASTAVYPWNGGETTADSPCVGEECTAVEARKANVAANKFCREVANFYEKTGNEAGYASIAIGWVGAIAGAVIAPSVSKYKDSWSGLSGAANTLRSDINSAFSAAVQVRRQAQVAKVANAAPATYLAMSAQAGTSNNMRVELSIDMVRQCALAGLTADSESLAALMGSGAKPVETEPK